MKEQPKTICKRCKLEIKKSNTTYTIEGFIFPIFFWWTKHRVCKDCFDKEIKKEKQK